MELRDILAIREGETAEWRKSRLIDNLRDWWDKTDYRTVDALVALTDYYESRQAPTVPKWEYRIVNDRREQATTVINELAADGWDYMNQSSAGNDCTTYTMRRQVREDGQ